MTAASDTDQHSRYTFDNATDEAARQVVLLSQILDGHSTDVLTRAGVTAGWRCLDLGTGAGSIAVWLADRVGPTGKVVALDADPRHVPAHDQIEVRAGDINEVDLGAGEYDLIHARLLLMHLPERERVVRRAAAALKPGGVLVVSDWGGSSTSVEDMVQAGSDGLAEAFRAYQEALLGLSVANGASLTWAQRIPGAMRDAGLVEVTGEIYNQVWAGGEPGCLLHASNSRQLEAPLVARGVSSEQLRTLREGMTDPATLAWTYPMVTATGRRAAG